MRITQLLLSISILFMPSALAEVKIKGSVIIYTGEITSEQTQKAIALFEQYQHKITEISMTSGGGNINAGMELAEFILAHRLDVRIPSFCFSSCANYVFVAGKHKYIGDNAIIGWHGDAASARWRDSDIDAMVAHLKSGAKEKQWQEYRAYYDNVIEEAVKRETALYEKLHLDKNIMQIGLSGDLMKAIISNRARGWSFNIEAMRELGVSGLPIDSTWSPKYHKNFPLIGVESPFNTNDNS
ncbi:hypothetical protein [Alteromonas stellipolaris]|uniref:hypothetical protein n=1 Tax=Alteromonas stellipolaris TaxID=233316 RepID=UPI002735F450|nr:hypothetical protein [Alteromonas stellipolaris]MDP2535941.1 hypothetical protein [Alteromonas stellipolaris]